MVFFGKFWPFFQEMFKDVDAIMDMPGYLYWEQIAEAFPEAKVILVERDENKWVESLIGMFKIIGDRRWFSFYWFFLFVRLFLSFNVIL